MGIICKHTAWKVISREGKAGIVLWQMKKMIFQRVSRRTAIMGEHVQTSRDRMENLPECMHGADDVNKGS